MTLSTTSSLFSFESFTENNPGVREMGFRLRDECYPMNIIISLISLIISLIIMNNK